jgi:hypothetical protein
MSEENKNTIRFVREDALSKGRLDLLDGLYTDDYVYHGPAFMGDLRGPRLESMPLEPMRSRIIRVR